MTEYSTYIDGDRRADVVKLVNWGCRLYKNGEVIRTEFYKGHNEVCGERSRELCIRDKRLMPYSKEVNDRFYNVLNNPKNLV